MADLIERLASVLTDLGPGLVPQAEQRTLAALCTTVTTAMGAPAASIAYLDEDAGELRWLAVIGPGAEIVAQQPLALGQGIAGFVAATGQSLAVDDVQQDPRFHAEIAERIGYVPHSILAVPILDDGGAVLGVLSVLDRTPRSDDLAVAGSFAAVAASVIPSCIVQRHIGAVLLETVADASANAGDAELAEALRRTAADAPPPQVELARVAAVLLELRSLGPRAHSAAVRIVEDALDLARAQRRR
jgi:signal transduction protein with GAF and PtsI domain